MPLQFFKRTTSSDYTEWTSFVPETSNDYPKYIIEGELDSKIKYEVVFNPFSITQMTVTNGWEEILKPEFDAELERVGSHPPQKP